jgi:polyisoprenoid-binding protein YceI
MVRRDLNLALFVAAGIAASLARAQESSDNSSIESIELDGARSLAEFSVKVGWLIPVHGRFGKVHGTVEADRFRNHAVVDARIDAKSVEMSTKSYEDWVKSDEFFDVAEHPEIRFVSESFPLQRLRKGGELAGKLTIRGIEQPATFKLEAAECEKPAYDCAIRVDGSIHRSEFGMRSKRGMLSDKVDLHFEVYAIATGKQLTP